MLVLKRKEGQWIEVTHAASGDVMRFRVYQIVTESGGLGRCNIAFEDDPRNFKIERPERFDGRGSRYPDEMPPPARAAGLGPVNAVLTLATPLPPNDRA